MIRELRTFVVVARDGTFAGAGQRIGLTQAAVSAQMQRLENELGFTLFDRTGRSARLNSMGHETLTRAEEILRLYKKRATAHNLYTFDGSKCLVSSEIFNGATPSLVSTER